MRSIKKSRLYGIIKKDLKAYDGRILLYKGEYCGGNDRCYGMFEFSIKDIPIIKVAVGNKTNERWFGVLIHEYCHFLQWKEQSKIWKDFEESNFNIEDIINNPKKFKKEILLLIRLEADCERRVIQLIRKYRLFDEKEYAKEANAVLYKYAFLYTDHFWPKGNPELKNCEELCPDRIHRSYLKYLEIPEDLYDVFASSRP
jgi:hypothetical protein